MLPASCSPVTVLLLFRQNRLILCPRTSVLRSILLICYPDCISVEKELTNLTNYKRIVTNSSLVTSLGFISVS